MGVEASALKYNKSTKRIQSFNSDISLKFLGDLYFIFIK